jgi:hypothetical protein
MESKNCSISLYENEVPCFVEGEMDRLYQCIFSSVAQFRIYGMAEDTSTYVVRKNGSITTIFLFRQNGGSIKVLNEVIAVSQEEIIRFSDYIFSNLSNVNLILFNGIQTKIERLPFPYQCVNRLENIVLSLPNTVDEYLDHLGKSTRKTIKGYSNKLKREHPTFTCHVYTQDEMEESHIREVVKFNKARMALKNITASYDEAEMERIIHLAKKYGMICIAEIDGKMCAGSLSYRIGDNFYMSINAHDPQYDEYRLGFLCAFTIISECIKRGGKECHMLWGRQDYKYRLLGVQRDLVALSVYRSFPQMLMNGSTALKMVSTDCKRRLGVWMHNTKKNNGVLGRLAGQSRAILKM